MRDVREEVLARLLEVVATIPNIRWAKRNNPDLPDAQSGLYPAVSVFDADEETDDVSDGGMRPPHRPTIVRMTPQIVLAQQKNEAGSDLTTLRRELIKRVLFDTELNETIVKTGRHGNGAIRYLGCTTDFAFGRSNYGGLVAQFLFKYALKPEEL